MATRGTVRRAHPLERAARADLDRRTLLRLLGGAAVLAGGGAAGLVSACSAERGDGSATGATSGTGAAGPVPAGDAAAPVVGIDDPTVPFWLQGNFAPVPDEHTVDATQLPIEGALPPELAGLYVRNGSNPATGRSPHWFLGDGMVHGVRLEGGRATWYRNRYVTTPFYERRQGFAEGGGPPGGARSQSNVSVFHHAGRLLSSGEVGLPYELRPDDLGTAGPFDFGGRLTTSMTAHPKIDPATGEMHFFGYGFVPPYLTYHVAAADGTLRHSEEVPLGAPLMIHDFQVTDRDVVFWALPAVFDLQRAMQMFRGGDAFPFRWDPQAGSRVGVMPLGGPTGAIRWFDVDPCFVFHGTNAYRDGDRVVMDVCRLPSVFADDAGSLPPSALHRWVVDLAGSSTTVQDAHVSDEQMDLPAIDRRFVGRRHRYGYYAAFHDVEHGLQFAGVNRFDHETQSIERWEPGPNEHAGEVVFVPRGDGAAEGDGWLLTYAYDRTRDRSDLVVLDAEQVRAGPVARVQLPVRVPYGFHGWWVPASML